MHQRSIFVIMYINQSFAIFILRVKESKKIELSIINFYKISSKISIAIYVGTFLLNMPHANFATKFFAKGA